MSGKQRRIERIKRISGEELNRRLEGEVRRAFEAVALAHDVRRIAASDPACARDLIARFVELLHRSGLDDLLADRMTYATRLTDGAGLAEEELKLESLCGDVVVLRELGLQAPDDVVAEYESALRKKRRAPPRRRGR